MKTRFPIEVVTWDDHADLCPDNSWPTESEVKEAASHPERIITVGFLMDETEDYLVLVRDIDGEDSESPQTGSPIKILKASVQKRRRLKLR